LYDSKSAHSGKAGSKYQVDHLYNTSFPALRKAPDDVMIDELNLEAFEIELLHLLVIQFFILVCLPSQKLNAGAFNLLQFKRISNSNVLLLLDLFQQFLSSLIQVPFLKIELFIALCFLGVSLFLPFVRLLF